MDILKIFDEKFHKIIDNRIEKIIVESNDIGDKTVSESTQPKSDNLSCSYCRIVFSDFNQQREHYKLDWHRYNLKQSLLTKKPISEDEFIELTNRDDLSSISGSDTEDNDDSDDYLTAQGRIYLQNEQKQTFSLYSCLLYDKKDDINNEILLERLKNCCKVNQKWTILMLGGGHFAGAIFDNTTPILHKTFHCYTVRSGQGGQQSSRDNKTGGSHPKSAGASLRRYNEQSLIQHVRNIVDLWRTDIDDSSLIFYRATGPYNRSVLFSGSAALLSKNDLRLRTIPFSTRRATFAEVKRVHSLLIQAQIYESIETALGHYSRRKLPEQPKSKNIRQNRSKSREIPDRSLEIQPDSSGSSGEDCDIIVDNGEIIDLEEFRDSLTVEERKIGQQQRKKRKVKKSKTQKLKEQTEKRRKEIVEILITGDIAKLEEFYNKQQNGQDDYFDEILDDDGNTFLHIVALNEHQELLTFLLENGANPCCKNNKQQTPYTCTNSREIRETLKQFARDNPERYNYNKAQIPINALTPEELAEKRKAQRKIKREKEKIKKHENAIKRQEDMEKERFLKLSDREKRALAAERRILQNQSGNITSRCFNCATDIAGKVPFEYSGNRFCSIDCLKAHRFTHPAPLS